MKKGDLAKLTVRKTLCKGDIKENGTHICSVLQYDGKQECIFLQLEKPLSLERVSLDTIYLCEIESEGGTEACTGRVKERYHDARGNVLRFEIENGFYKINIKSLTNI